MESRSRPVPRPTTPRATVGSAEAAYVWRCYYYADPDDVRTSRELGHGRAATYAEALRAVERAAGWDRQTQAVPPATARRDAMGVINRTAFAAI